MKERCKNRRKLCFLLMLLSVLIMNRFSLWNMEVYASETEQTIQEDVSTPPVSEKSEGSASVTLEGWIYTPDNSSANLPVPVSETNGTANVTYQYKASGASDDTYTGAIPNQAGNYTVKATFPETETYKEAVATANFTIQKARPSITFEKVDEEDGLFSIRVNAVGEAELIITTDNESVAVVDLENRIVRFIGTGKVRIIAGMDASSNYEALTVATEVTIEKVKKMAAIVPEKEEYNVTYANPGFTINIIYKKGDADITYHSDNERVARVDDNGRVFICGSGSTVITASMAEDENYYGTSAEIRVNVEKAYTPPSMPIDGADKAEVSVGTETLDDVSLPYGWRWKNPDMQLIPGGIVKACAVYDERENYRYYEKVVELYKQAEIMEEASDDLYTIGKDQDATIKSTGALSEFRTVFIDGTEVATDDYTLAEGSTILTLRKSYMDSLEPGEHKVTLSYTAGDVETVLTVKEKEPAAIVLENTDYDKVYGDPDFTIEVIQKLGDAEISFHSDNENVAMVDADGKVSVQGTGNAVITASMEEDDHYRKASAKAQIHVAKASLPPFLPFDGTGRTEASSEIEKTGDISLPQGWRWKDPEVKVISGEITKAYVVYDEQDNYEYYETSVEIHKKAELVKETDPPAEERPESEKSESEKPETERSETEIKETNTVRDVTQASTEKGTENAVRESAVPDTSDHSPIVFYVILAVFSGYFLLQISIFRVLPDMIRRRFIKR